MTNTNAPINIVI